MSDYKVSSLHISHAEQLREEWLDLQMRSQCSYFQSWSWISCWLQIVAFEKPLMLVRVRQGERLMGLRLFTSADIVRRKFIRCSVMYLNEYPLADDDMVMEYNGLLAQSGCEQEVYQHVAQYLLQKFPAVDEFHFGALAQKPAYEYLAACNLSGVSQSVQLESTSWQVDLTKFDSGMDAYLATLSKNSRAQIRRTHKHYEQDSVVELQVAENVEQALSYFDELKILHIKRWQEKDQQHAFADEKWEKFHRYIIEQRFDSGEIQMIKIMNEQQAVAYLFNYVWRERVYVLQMGFNYTDNKRIKPGYLAHAMAVVYNRDKGMHIYDFMHGYSRYKSSLSDLSEKLVWVVLQRPRLKFRFEQLAVRIVRAIRKTD